MVGKVLRVGRGRVGSAGTGRQYVGSHLTECGACARGGGMEWGELGEREGEW